MHIRYTQWQTLIRIQAPFFSVMSALSRSGSCTTGTTSTFCPTAYTAGADTDTDTALLGVSGMGKLRLCGDSTSGYITLCRGDTCSISSWRRLGEDTTSFTLGEHDIAL